MFNNSRVIFIVMYLHGVACHAAQYYSPQQTAVFKTMLLQASGKPSSEHSPATNNINIPDFDLGPGQHSLEEPQFKSISNDQNLLTQATQSMSQARTIMQSPLQRRTLPPLVHYQKIPLIRFVKKDGTDRIVSVDATSTKTKDINNYALVGGMAKQVINHDTGELRYYKIDGITVAAINKATKNKFSRFMHLNKVQASQPHADLLDESYIIALVYSRKNRRLIPSQRSTPDIEENPEEPDIELDKELMDIERSKPVRTSPAERITPPFEELTEARLAEIAEQQEGYFKERPRKVKKQKEPDTELWDAIDFNEWRYNGYPLTEENIAHPEEGNKYHIESVEYYTFDPNNNQFVYRISDVALVGKHNDFWIAWFNFHQNKYPIIKANAAATLGSLILFGKNPTEEEIAQGKAYLAYAMDQTESYSAVAQAAYKLGQYYFRQIGNGSLSQRKTLIDEALKYFKKSYKVQEEIFNDEIKTIGAKAAYHLGLLYSNILPVKDIQKAEYYFNEALNDSVMRPQAVEKLKEISVEQATTCCGFKWSKWFKKRNKVAPSAQYEKRKRAFAAEQESSSSSRGSSPEF